MDKEKKKIIVKMSRTDRIIVSIVVVLLFLGLFFIPIMIMWGDSIEKDYLSSLTPAERNDIRTADLEEKQHEEDLRIENEKESEEWWTKANTGMIELILSPLGFLFIGIFIGFFILGPIRRSGF